MSISVVSWNVEHLGFSGQGVSATRENRLRLQRHV